MRKAVMGIQSGRFARGNVRRGECNQQQQESDGSEDQLIAGAGPIEEAGHHPGEHDAQAVLASFTAVSCYGRARYDAGTLCVGAAPAGT